MTTIPFPIGYNDSANDTESIYSHMEVRNTVVGIIIFQGERCRLPTSPISPSLTWERFSGSRLWSTWLGFIMVTLNIIYQSLYAINNRRV